MPGGESIRRPFRGVIRGLNERGQAIRAKDRLNWPGIAVQKTPLNQTTLEPSPTPPPMIPAIKAEMRCPPLPPFELADWSAVRAAFARLPAWEFRQHWQPSLTPGFRRGLFRAGCWSDALVVLGDLDDDDIFNPAARFNEEAYRHGDTFEMFLQPEGQDAYYEFHVTPDNHKLQLRFPSPAEFRTPANGRRRTSIDEFKQSQPLFRSVTQVDHAATKWSVVVSIPFASVVETPEAARLRRWRFSASRYDYTRGKARPVLSSTSLHTHCDFHRIEEWGVLSLTPATGPSESMPLATAATCLS